MLSRRTAYDGEPLEFPVEVRDKALARVQCAGPSTIYLPSAAFILQFTMAGNVESTLRVFMGMTLNDFRTVHSTQLFTLFTIEIEL